MSKKLKTQCISWLATWFGAGRLPLAPGTWGTLFGTPLIWLMVQTGPYVYLALTVVLVLVAMVVAHAYQLSTGQEDPKEVVIDEVAGWAVSMVWLPLTWQTWLLAFVLFRVLDTFKPPPIGWLDKNIKGGVGIVADDIVAGMIVNVVMQQIYMNTMWLGVQGSF